jgi:hypothetical protein
MAIICPFTKYVKPVVLLPFLKKDVIKTIITTKLQVKLKASKKEFVPGWVNPRNGPVHAAAACAAAIW